MANSSYQVVKMEDVIMADGTSQPPKNSEELEPKFCAAPNIAYWPKAALQEGLSMLKALGAIIEKIELGKLCLDVWMREVET